jgi:hypothetical protein
MTTNISRPFRIDPKIHPAVTAAHEQLTARYKANAATAKVEYENKLEQRWEEAERKRKADFLAKWRYDNPPVRLPNPHSDLNDAGVVRVATPAEDRLRVLGNAFTDTRDSSFLVELLRTYLYRRSSTAPLADVKAVLSEFIEVNGTEEIFTESPGEHFVPGSGPVGHGKHVPHRDRRVIAGELSIEAVNVLRYFSIQRDVVWFAGALEYIDKPGIRGEKITPAHKMVDEYPPDEY